MPEKIQARGEDLRRAIRWLSDQGDYRAAAIDEAARKFDLSPLDTDFLITHFARQRPPAGAVEGGSE